MKPPKRIWLQWNDPDILPTWCRDKVNDDDVEYVLANTEEPQLTEGQCEETIRLIIDGLKKGGFWINEETYGDISIMIRKILNANTTEDDWVADCPICNSRITRHDVTLRLSDNQIALRKIEEVYRRWGGGDPVPNWIVQALQREEE